MSIPFVQKYRVGRYLMAKKLKREQRYPLVLMLEPLFQCNLACAGCGKIDYPMEILKRRLSVEECLESVDECGAPVVSIAGGEPLLHTDMPEIVRGIMARKKFVYLCTNAMLLKKKMDDYEPSPYFTWSVHLDGNRERHDESVCREGVYDVATAAIRQALERGFRVTINCTLFDGEVPAEVAEFFDTVTELGVEGITVSPGYSYERAPRQDVFLGRNKAKELFRGIFREGKKRDKAKRWRFNHSSLFLDFLAGNQGYQCKPWGNPCRNVFGWQKPCYLLVSEGYAPTFQALMEDTNWDNWGTGRNPKCDNCMAHCGYEATAVDETFGKPLKALWTSLRGPRTEGPMAPELPITYDRAAYEAEVAAEVAADSGAGTGAQAAGCAGASCSEPEAVAAAIGDEERRERA